MNVTTIAARPLREATVEIATEVVHLLIATERQSLLTIR